MRQNWKRSPSAFARICAIEYTTRHAAERAVERLRPPDQRKGFVRFARLRIIAAVVTDHAELDRKARVENVHVLGSHPLEHALGLVLGDSENDLQRLVSQLEHVRRVMGARVSDAFG